MKTQERLSNILSGNMRLMEEFGQRKYEEGRTEGIKKGIKKTEWEIAKELLNEDMTITRISEITNIPIAQLEQM